MATTTLSFLIEESEFDVDLPGPAGTFDPAPMLRGVLNCTSAGEEITFFPSSRFPDPRSIRYWQFVSSGTYRGVPVQVFLRPDAIVPEYVICWTLGGGYLVTCVEEPTEGIDGVNKVIDDVRIDDPSAPVPHITLGPNSVRADQKEPTNRDDVMFWPPSTPGSQSDVTFTRDPRARSSRAVHQEGDTVLGVASASGVSVTVVGRVGEGEALLDRATAIAESISAR